MAITREDIIHAAETLQKDGDKPTMASVREFLGGGSFATISPVLREWRESRKTTTAVVLDMPGDLKTVLERLGSEFWQASSGLANEKLVTVQAEAEVAVTEAQTERDETLQEVSRLEANLELAAAQQQESEQANQNLQEQFGQLQADVIRLREQLSASKTEAGRLRDDLQGMAKEKDRQADEASRLLGLNEELNRNLKNQQASSSIVQDQLNEARVEASSLKDRLQHMTTEAQALKEDCRQVPTLQAETNTASTRIEELTQECLALRQENKALTKENGRLDGQVSQLSVQLKG